MEDRSRISDCQIFFGLSFDVSHNSHISILQILTTMDYQKLDLAEH